MKYIFLRLILIGSVLSLIQSESQSQWVRTGLTANDVLQFAASDTDLFACMFFHGVFRSTNSGESWTEVNNGLTNANSWAIAGSGLNLFVVTSGGVFLSTNNGTSWNKVNAGFTHAFVRSFVVSPNGAGGFNLFAGTWGKYGSGEGVFISTDNGVSWTKVNSGLQDINVTTLAVSPNGAGGSNLFAGTFAGVFFSTNNGMSWTKASSDSLIRSVNSLAVNGSNLLAGAWGGVYLSTDNGINWTASNTGMTNNSINCFAVSDTNTFAGTPGGVFLSTNNGSNWMAVTRNLADTNVHALVVSGKYLFAETDSGVWRRPLAGLIPRIEITPSVVNFGDVPIGRSSDTVIVIAKNQSAQPLTVKSISNTRSIFSILGPVTFPMTLAPSDTIQIRVLFRPTIRGVANDLIVVATSDTVNPIATVALQGNGITTGPQFQAFVDRVKAAQVWERTAIVDSFMAVHQVLPFIEQDTICYFIYRDYSASVNIPGDANGWALDAFPMTRLSSTSLWIRPEVFESDARLEYKFYLNGTTWLADPRNPRIVGSTGNSELRMPKYIQPPEILYYPDIPHGTLSDTTFFSNNLVNSRTIRVYTPYGYNSAGSDSCPVVFFHDGLDYITEGYALNVLDYLIWQKRIPPTIGVFVPPVNRGDEYTGIAQNKFAAFIATELLAYIDARYKTQRSPLKRANVGISNGGNIALWIAYNYPNVFGNTGSFSGGITVETDSAFQNGMLRPLKLYIDSGTYEVFIYPARELRRIFGVVGYDYRYNEWHESHSWSNWGSHLDNALEYFFPGSALNVIERGTLPKAFQLMQNYPNPFNPSTTVRYAVSTTSHVKVQIYNVLGQVVAELVNGEQSAGWYQIKWNAKVASGVYFYRFDAESISEPTERLVQVKKMLLLQ